MYTAAELAQLIKRAGGECVTEMEVQIAIEKVLDPVIRDLPSRSHFGRRATKLGGIPDALHGSVIIEYERPGKLATKRGRAEAIGQLQRYIVEEAAAKGGETEGSLRKVVGIALDGRQIAFVRYRSSEWRNRYDQQPQLKFFDSELPSGFTVVEPAAISPDNVDLLVGYLRSLVQSPLTPEALAKVFGPETEIARGVVGALYSKLTSSRHPRVETFFSEWKRLFGIVYGQEVKKGDAITSELATQFGVGGKPELKALLFCVHTYFATVMKLLAAEVMSMQRGSLLPSFIQPLSAMSLSELREALTDLEEGTLFQRYGISNFLEGDFFSWYLRELDKELADGIRRLARALAQFDPRTPYLAPEQSRDLLKKLYQYLVPSRLRHDLGEYYTPDWIAEALLDKIGFEGKPEQRLLDPACGSGTFLVTALKRMKLWAQEETPPVPARALAKRVLSNLCGFDLNPIAVIAARTNFLLTLGELVRLVRPIEIPVYMCDSVLTPHLHRSQKDLENPGFPVTTRAGEFIIPREYVQRGRVGDVATVLEESVKGKSSSRIFIERVRREVGINNPDSELLLRNLFEEIVKLESEDRNRIWARFIKNSFAPIFKRKHGFQFVVGNPPWVNWQSLAEEYKGATKRLWKEYGFFTQKGYKALVPAGTLDLAAMFFYVAVDAYLAKGGTLGFVITQSLFQSHGAGEGFRRLLLPDGDPIRMVEAEDLVELRPFEGAQNRTAVVIARKGCETQMPLDYQLWKPTTEYHKLKRATQFEPSYKDVVATTTRIMCCATNVNPSDITSPWLIAPKGFLPVAEKLRGATPLKARVGIHTFGANGIFWLKVLEDAGRRYLLVKNYKEGAKEKDKLRTVEHRVERELVYPLLRGRDVQRWFARPSLHILLTHPPGKPKQAYPAETMATDFPQALAYLTHFKSMLSSREMCERLNLDWYALGKMGPYVFSPYRLVWREQAARLTAAVVEPSQADEGQIAVADHKLTITPFQNRDEAHYFCACINSAPLRAFVRTHVITTQVSTHLYENIKIEAFDRGNAVHRRLAELSIAAHEQSAAMQNGAKSESRMSAIENEIGDLAAKLWRLTPAERKEVEVCLELFLGAEPVPKKAVERAVSKRGKAPAEALTK